MTAIVAVSAGIFAYNNSERAFKYLVSSDVEALTMTECISSSAGNNGKCEAALNGSGDVCVDRYWWEAKDCVSHM